MPEVDMTDLIAYIAKSLVDRPEEVEVHEVEGDQGPIIELRVAKEDLGKVIGKQGRTARALRTLLAASPGRGRRRVTLEIID